MQRVQLSSSRQAELLLRLYSLQSEARVDITVVCQYLNRQGKELREIRDGLSIGAN